MSRGESAQLVSVTSHVVSIGILKDNEVSTVMEYSCHLCEMLVDQFRARLDNIGKAVDCKDQPETVRPEERKVAPRANAKTNIIKIRQFFTRCFDHPCGDIDAPRQTHSRSEE